MRYGCFGGFVGVSATNLKEVEVKFNGTVDEDSATDAANYSLKSGKAIKSVAFSADKNAVTITLEGTLSNNKTEALTVSNVVAGDNTINEKNIEFKVADNKLPEVSEIKSLGTKSVKVAFSEPVSGLQQSNFTLDGKAFFGKIDMGAGNKSAILTPFSTSALAVGDHSITVSGVKDYANFVSLNSTHNFTVVEDKDAPTVTEATATLESVTLTFSEDVDASTVLASKVYWKSGSSKKEAASVETLADNKFKFTFSTVSPDNSLPTGAVDIYVEGVKDYSNNEIAKDTKVSVTPVIDQTRPEVRKVVSSSATAFKVTFSKNVDATTAVVAGNYTVTDKDGKVISVKTATVDADKKSVNVELYTALSVGENTLTVKNVKDATKLKNTMLDYTGKIVRADKTAPKFDSDAVVNPTDLRVVVKFNKKMDVATLADYSNYLVTIDGTLQTLSADIADISITQDGSAVIIQFAETVNGKEVVFDQSATSHATKTYINKLTVLGVKDAAGNLLQEFAGAGTANEITITRTATPIALDNIDADTKVGAVANLVDRRTVKVKFKGGINSATAAAFTTTSGPAISSYDVDGSSTVTLKFDADINTDGSNLALVVNNAGLEDIAGNKGTVTSDAITKGPTLIDSVAPVVMIDPVLNAATGVITLTYSEALTDNSNLQQLLNSDFTVIRNSDNKKLDIRTGYTVAVGNTPSTSNIVTITLNDAADRPANTEYRVSVDAAKYITDKAAKNNVISNYSHTTSKVATLLGGTLVQTTAGNVGSAGTAQVNTLTVANAASTAAGNITVSFDDGGTPVVKTVAVLHNDTDAVVAGKISAAFATGLTGYTAANSASADVVFTAAAPATNKTVTITIVDTDTTGVGTATDVDTTPGVAPVASVKQVATFTVTGVRDTAGNITVTFNDSTTPVVKTVAVAAGDTSAQVAAKIKAAFATGLTGWTATNADADVIFTADAAAADAVVTVTLAN